MRRLPLWPLALFVFEKDQPEGFLPPVIKYRTNEAETLEPRQVGVERRSGVTTFTFEGPHFLRPGEWVRISGVSDVSFHGDFFVASVPTRESFTVLQPGAPDLRGNFGMFESRELGGSITGGAFSEGTAFPPEYRGRPSRSEAIGGGVADHLFERGDAVHHLRQRGHAQ